MHSLQIRSLYYKIAQQFALFFLKQLCPTLLTFPLFTPILSMKRCLRLPRFVTNTAGDAYNVHHTFSGMEQIICG